MNRIVPLTTLEPMEHTSQAPGVFAPGSLSFHCDPFLRSNFSAYLEVFNAIVDAGG